MSESPQDEHLSYGRHVKKLDKKLVRAAKAILEIMHLIESQRRNLEKGIYSNEREYNATQDCTNGYNGKYDGKNRGNNHSKPKKQTYKAKKRK